jgi:hypothetical protein
VRNMVGDVRRIIKMIHIMPERFGSLVARLVKNEGSKSCLVLFTRRQVAMTSPQ